MTPGKYLTEDEFYDVCIILKPNITREEFEKAWQKFQDEKKQYEIRMQIQ